MIARALTLGGHDFTSRPADRAICELMLRLASTRAERRPRICLVAGADAEASERTARFYSAFGERPCDPSDLSPSGVGGHPAEWREHLLAQDLIHVDGGDLLDLLAGWEARDLGGILGEAWRRGVVLAGQGAGAMCWFEAAITGSTGGMEAAAGLGLLKGSLCVHYSDEPDRRAAYMAAVGNGMPGGYGLDDHAGLIWEGTDRPSAVTAQRGARAYRVAKGKEGEVVESALPARFLTAPAPAALREDIAEYRRITAMRKRAGWPG